MASFPTRRLRQAVAAADVVHTNNLPGITTGIWAAAGARSLPVVHTLHDYYLLCPRMTLFGTPERPCCAHPGYCSARRHRLGRWSGRVSDVIGVSRFVVDRHAELFAGARRHVIRHPVVPGDGTAVPAPTRPTTIGYLGSLDEIKGVGLLLSAVPELRAAGWTVRIAGNGRLRPKVEAAAGIGLLDYRGTVAGAEKRAFLADCDIGVVPSVWFEPGGPPFVVLEWLAAGRPVLVSDRGGLPEATETFAGAMTFEPTVAALSSALEQLRSPGGWRDVVSRLGPVGSPDEPERWLREHEQVYRAALGELGDAAHVKDAR